jgi:hypothetical protein
VSVLFTVHQGENITRKYDRFASWPVITRDPFQAVDPGLRDIQQRRRNYAVIPLAMPIRNLTSFSRASFYEGSNFSPAHRKQCPATACFFSILIYIKERF